MTENKKYPALEIKTLPGSEAEIIGDIAKESLEEARLKTIKKLQSESEISGFRKGHAPKSLVVQKYGDARILEMAAETVLHDEYPEIIIASNLKVISNPEITITKLAPGNPLGFKIRVAVLPEISLPDYKSIAKKTISKIKENSLEITDDDVKKITDELRKNFASIKKPSESLPPETVNEGGDKKEPELPELNDEFVKLFGDFKNTEEFKTKIKENLVADRMQTNRDKRRLALSEEIVKATKLETPKILVDNELARMIANFKADIARSGASYEEYLGRIKKTEEDIKKEWRDGAEKKAKFQLIVSKIAHTENLKPEKTEIENEAKHLKEHHKDIDEDQIRAYVELMLTNEKVLNFLENQK